MMATYCGLIVRLAQPLPVSNHYRHCLLVRIRQVDDYTIVLTFIQYSGLRNQL